MPAETMERGEEESDLKHTLPSVSSLEHANPGMAVPSDCEVDPVTRSNSGIIAAEMLYRTCGLELEPPLDDCSSDLAIHARKN